MLCKNDYYASYCQPDDMYRGTDFWMLNGALDDEEIERQLTSMKEQGVYSFIARTYIGLKSDYPGPDFKARLHKMVETAGRLNMKLYLQAGYMPEHVLGLPKEYALCNLRVHKVEAGKEPVLNAEEEEEILCRCGDFVFTKYNTITFLDMFNLDSMKFYLKVCYEDVWKEFQPDYGKTIVSVWVDEPSYSSEAMPYPLGIDKVFEERWGYSLRENVYKLFLDIDDYRSVRYHYHKLLQDQLEKYYFSMVRAWCNDHHIMASGHLMMEDTLASQILRAGAVMPFYKYFDMPGIDILCAEMNWKDSPMTPNRTKNYSFRSMLTTTPIQCASAARQMGAEHILCEMYGVAGQDYTFRNQKYQFDYISASGINHRSVHGIFYSLKGRGKRAYPPHINYYQPYWKDEHQVYDYVASTSRFVSIGQPEGETLVLHPLDSAFCFYTPENETARIGYQSSLDQLHALDALYKNVLLHLSLNHCVFDLGDERSIEDIGSIRQASDGTPRFVIGKMAYKRIVLPYLTEIQKQTLDKIRAFADLGGQVIIVGKDPLLLDGVPSAEDLFEGIPNVTRVPSEHELTALLESSRSYCFETEEDDRSVWIRRRTEDGQAWYFLFNSDCSEPKHGTLTIRGQVRAEIWDPLTKERKAVAVSRHDGLTQMDLDLPEGGSLQLYTVETEETPLMASVSAGAEKKLALSQTWQVERKDPNALVLEFCSYKKAAPGSDDAEYSEEFPVLAVQQILTEEDYHGPLSLKFTFRSEMPIQGLRLALEDAGEQQIFLNGCPALSGPNGYYWAKAFETVDLPACRAGENTIEVFRTFEPLEKMKSAIGSLFTTRRGVELESLYLVGEFAVHAAQEPERNGSLRYSRFMTLAPEVGEVRGELTKAGYVFYAGTLALTQKFLLAEDPKGAVLHLDELRAFNAHVFVNGIDCGTLNYPPYEIAVGDALCKGDNTITLEITNTLRNLLGPYHRPEGEFGAVWGGYASPDASYIGIGLYDPDYDWYNHRIPDTKHWTDSYLQKRLGVTGPSILWK